MSFACSVNEYIPPVTTCGKFGTVGLFGVSRKNPEKFRLASNFQGLFLRGSATCSSNKIDMFD